MATQDLLTLLLTDEIARRDGAAVDNRVSAAKLDPEMGLERFDKSAKITFDKKLFAELCSLRFLNEHRHVVILGAVGVGRTFIANALGHLACPHRYDVRFIRADQMLSVLRKSRLDNSHDAEMAALCSVDLLIVDDFALEPMSREESKDIYQLFVERTGRASTIITSNRDTAEWIRMFDDVLLAQSAIDRFMNAAFDLVIEGESYRPRLEPKLEADPTPDAPADKRPRRSRPSKD
jgi:DNA replication protein DnaC